LHTKIDRLHAIDVRGFAAGRIYADPKIALRPMDAANQRTTALFNEGKSPNEIPAAGAITSPPAHDAKLDGASAK
jgi:hypothetical protein